MNKLLITYLAGSLLCIAIFIIDLLTELGVAGGVPYIIVVLLGLFSNQKQYFVISGISGVFLTILGYYLSPSGGELWKIILNRAYAIMAIAVTAILCFRENRSKAQLLEANNNLESKVEKRTKELRDLNNKVQKVVEQEKISISREIHDDLGQTLTAIKLDLSWLEKKLNTSKPLVLEKIKSIYSLLDNSFHTVRKISTELRPQSLEVMGFDEALQWQVEEFITKTEIKCNLIAPKKLKLPADLSTDLFRIVQEALTNVSRHSQANYVEIKFIEDEDNFKLTIQDDGIGIKTPLKNHIGSLGLLGISERALKWGGVFEIKGRIGEGTRLEITVPKSTSNS